MASLLELPKAFTQEDRIKHVLDHAETYISWVEDPVKHDQWSRYANKYQVLRTA